MVIYICYNLERLMVEKILKRQKIKKLFIQGRLFHSYSPTPRRPAGVLFPCSRLKTRSIYYYSEMLQEITHTDRLKTLRQSMAFILFNHCAINNVLCLWPLKYDVGFPKEVLRLPKTLNKLRCKVICIYILFPYSKINIFSVYSALQCPQKFHILSQKKSLVHFCVYACFIIHPPIVLLHLSHSFPKI